MRIEFIVKDKTSRLIRLTETQWKHLISEHPLISAEQIIYYLQQPLRITQSKRDKKVCYYFLRNTEDRNYLFVAVK